MKIEEVWSAVRSRRDYVDSLLSQLATASSAPPPGITRDAFGEGEDAAYGIVRRASEELGLSIRMDEACNMYSTWQGAQSGQPPIYLGSHLDSVPNGGNFDGAAGIVAGIAAIAILKDLGLTPRPAICLLSLRSEESPWFNLSLLGSRCALAMLPANGLDLRHSRTGKTLAESIRERGGKPEAIEQGKPLIDSATAYFEVHIEQAPQLVEADTPVAVCLANPGYVRHPAIRIVGESGHTGLPRRFRRDAALAAADLRLALDDLWREQDTMGKPMALTVGKLFTDASSHGMTIVPGVAEMSLDLRAYDRDHHVQLEERLTQIVSEIAKKHDVSIDLGPRSAAVPCAMDPDINAGLSAAAAELGLNQMELHSPGTHDANNFAAAGIPVGMLLVRNRNGSHNPDEAMEVDDLVAAVAMLVHWLAVNACDAQWSAVTPRCDGQDG